MTQRAFDKVQPIPINRTKSFLSQHHRKLRHAQTLYSSILQVSSYLIVETENTSEMRAAVVKGQALFRKNTAQHLSDLTMLQQTIPLFKDSLTKDKECIRV